MYFRDCKTLSVFESKIPLTLEFRFIIAKTRKWLIKIKSETMSMV
jgi:hypothetical protein